MKFKILIVVSVLLLATQQVLAQDQIFGRPSYSFACVLSRWGNQVHVAEQRLGELYESAYAAVLGGVTVRGWMHKGFTWKGQTGSCTARFDFAFCGEFAVGTAVSSAEIRVIAFLRDVTTGGYPIDACVYRYRMSGPGYRVFIDGRVINKAVEMVKGHRYTIGYMVDVSASCYPRSPCPMANANVGEQGCSFWWQPTGIFGRS